MRIILAILLMAPTVRATTWYVERTGSDANTGKSWAQSCATITFVNDSTTASDTVWFGTGVFRGQLEPISGTAANPTVYACSAFTEGIASIWGSDSLVGWTNHGGNVWKTEWDATGTVYTVGQIDDTYDTLLYVDTAIPTAAKYFYHATGPDPDSLYVWLYGNGDPSEDSISIEAVNPNGAGVTRKAVAFLPNVKHAKIWGFKLRYGDYSVVRFREGADSNYVEHCHISRTCGIDNTNKALISSNSMAPRNDSTEARWGNVIRACSLMGLVFDDDMTPSSGGQQERSAIVFYGQWGAVVESCVIIGYYKQGIYLKSDCHHFTIRHNYIELKSGTASVWAGIRFLSSYRDLNIYGNMIVLDDIGEMGVDCEGLYYEGQDPYGYEHCGDISITNNTIINASNIGLVAPKYDGVEYHNGNNIFKYNIVYLVPDANEALGGIAIILNSDSLYWSLDSNMYYVVTGDTVFRVGTYSGFGSTYDLPTWRSRFGFDVNTTVGTDPAFNDTTSNDYTRPGASGEMNETYGGKTWTVYGALQNAGNGGATPKRGKFKP